MRNSSKELSSPTKTDRPWTSGICGRPTYQLKKRARPQTFDVCKHRNTNPYKFVFHQTVEGYHSDHLEILPAGQFPPSILVNDLTLTPPQILPPLSAGAPHAAVYKKHINRATVIHMCQLLGCFLLVPTITVFPLPILLPVILHRRGGYLYL